MRSHKRFGLIVTVAAAILLVLPAAVAPAKDAGVAQTVVDVEFLGEVVVPTGTLYGGTEIGGLSSITYDTARGVYYALSDDQGNRPTGDPVRYYTVARSTSPTARSTTGTCEFVDVTQLFESKKTPVRARWARSGRIHARSRGHSSSCHRRATCFADPIIEPFIMRYNRNGPRHDEPADT